MCVCERVCVGGGGGGGVLLGLYLPLPLICETVCRYMCVPVAQIQALPVHLRWCVGACDYLNVTHGSYLQSLLKSTNYSQ